MINLALGFLVGLAVGVGAAVLLETLDTRIKSIEALTKHFEQPLLGVIGFEADAEKKPLLTDVQGQSKRAESFRQVRTNLQFVDIDHRPKSIVITSSVPREGKTTTAINLAITIAQTGQPVFLIEGDLRRPKVADYLDIEGGAGLTDVLVGRATVDEVLQPWGSHRQPLGDGVRAAAAEPVRAARQPGDVRPRPPPREARDADHRRAAAAAGHRRGGADPAVRRCADGDRAPDKTRREQLRTAESEHRRRRRKDPRPGA